MAAGLAAFSIPLLPSLSQPAAAAQQISPGAVEDDTAYIQQLLDNPVGNVVDLPYRSPANPFVVRPGLTIPKGEVISGHGTTLKVMSGSGNYRAILSAPASTDLSGLTIKGVDFDQNSSGNPISGTCASAGSSNCLSPTAPRFVLAVISGSGITITQNTFTGTDNTNTVVTGSATHNVIVSGNSFSTVDTPWHDHSSVYTSGTGTEIYGNTFTGNAAVAAAIEVHGDQVNISGNKVSGYYRAVNIAASDTTLSNNTLLGCANVVDLFSVTAPSLHNVVITQNSIQLNLPYWRQVMQSMGRTMPPPQYTQFVIYDASSTYPFSHITISGNTSVPLN